ncbi:protein kinase family protein [Klenkia sp. LSe6-5]|uniref:Protein kinase family protein n=1 Tax=Klenkia sesuvii TaxID=3103137 RepID=A0ABU8DT65_9ACTN
MTSTTTGLPDRYRPIDQLAPDEPTATGVIRSWRARDRVLNRDVALRVHTPGGAAARSWIARALTAGGLATPALSMVYDAAEGTPDDSPSAYVVNEWIEGQTLTERLRSGPLPEREARVVVRRLAEGVAEAHRVGLAVGGLTPDHVVLRPGGLVGLLAVPAAEGTVPGDVAALGALLELCLTGERGDEPGATPPHISQPDLAALVRRARSTEPGTALSSVAAMAALLGDRPRTGHTDPHLAVRGEESESGWLRKLRDRRDAEDAAARPAPARPAPGHPAPGHPGPGRDDAVPLTRDSYPPVPLVDDDADERSARGATAGGYDGSYVGGYDGSDTAEDDELEWAPGYDEDEVDDEPGEAGWRRRLLVVGLPLLALAMVIAAGWWLGTNVISAASSVDDVQGSRPSAAAPTEDGGGATDGDTGTPAGTPLEISVATVFDPFGDGEPENDDDVPLSYDGDPATSWPTLTYRGSASFGNLKPGVGVRYDLGSEQSLSGVTVTGTEGAVVQVRTGSGDELDGYAVAAEGTLGGGAEDLSFAEPVTTRYVLVWVTELVPADGGFAAGLAEVSPLSAG